MIQITMVLSNPSVLRPEIQTIVLLWPGRSAGDEAIQSTVVQQLVNC